MVERTISILEVFNKYCYYSSYIMYVLNYICKYRFIILVYEPLLDHFRDRSLFIAWGGAEYFRCYTVGFT